VPRRTLLCLSIAFILGVALGVAPWAVLPIALTGLVFVFIARRSHNAVILLLCAAAFGLGFLRVNLIANRVDQLGQGPWRGRAITAVEVTSSGQYKGKVRIEPGGQVVMLYSRAEWAQHDGVRFRGSVAEPLRAKNPGELDYQAVLERQGVAAVVFAESVDIVARFRPGLMGRVRTFLSGSLSVLAKPQRALAQALVLGERSLLTDAIRDNWRKAGASHLLAVSGLHVSIVGGAVFYLMRRRFGMRPSSLAATLTVVLYAGVIGHSMSAWRAALTFALVSLAEFVLRRQHWPTTVSFVAATLLLFSPLSLTDPGFQLSFLAALSIMHLSPLLTRLLPASLPRGVTTLLSASMAAQIATMPIVAIHFSAVPLYGLLSSLLLIPLAPALLVLALLTALLGAVPLLGQAAGGLFSLASLPFMWATSAIARLPMSTLNTVAAPWFLLMGYYLFLLGLPRLNISRLQRTAILTLAVLFIVLVPGVFLLSERSITILAVGNADAIHIRVGTSHVLVDTAEAATMQRAVLPYLASQGVNRLQSVFITHSHSDHAGGLPALLAGMRVDRIIAGPESRAVRQVSAGVEVIEARMGMLVQGKGYSIRFLMVEKEGLSLNNRSAAMLVTCGTLRVVLAADIEKEAEALLSGNLTQADVLKVAHHGSASSSTPAFLAAVRPKVAVISVGPNRYGHPAAATLENLAKSGATVLRTDESGAVRLRLRRGQLLVYGFNGGRFELLGKYTLPGKEVNEVVINWKLSGSLAASQAA
jgi:competence protein ComEC